MDRAGLIELLSNRGVSRRVLDAIASVPRELFVPEDERSQAWENHPVSIGYGQTISQPEVVATMCELLGLGEGDVVLDVGGGSGYHAAVLGRLARRVFSVELQVELVETARRALAEAEVDNVTMVPGDGSLGLRGEAPFDAINVAAAVQGEMPVALPDQLAECGRMVVPVGRAGQWLELWRRHDGQLSRVRVAPVAFVPLVERDR